MPLGWDRGTQDMLDGVWDQWKLGEGTRVQCAQNRGNMSAEIWGLRKGRLKAALFEYWALDNWG